MFLRVLRGRLSSVLSVSSVVKFPALGRLGLFAVFYVLAVTGANAQSAPLTANIAAEHTDVFVGEPFAVQIQIDGTTSIAQPDMSTVRDFDVQFGGASPNRSTQVSIVNGRMTRHNQESVTLSYQFTARRAGRLTIPALTLAQGKQTVRTRAVQIQARKPDPSSSDGAFEMTLAKTECYVGEPVKITWTAFLPDETRRLEFNIPLLQRPEFDFPSQEPDIDPRKREQYRKMSLGPNLEVVGLLDNAIRKGRRYTTMTFSLTMIPRTPGTFSLPTNTAICQVAVGHERQRQRTPFDMFNRPRERLQRIVLASESPELTVRELPSEGRPASFCGYIGRLQVSVRAEPTVANVGDPINLRILISGSGHIASIECPDIEAQPGFAKSFRVSGGDVAGEVQGNVKVFKKTLRATNPDVTEIPPIKIAYFDAGKGTYEVATSKAIPLTVKATKVITAMDAEGTAPVSSAGKALRAWSKGIAHNYEDAGVLINQQMGIDVWIGSAAWLATLGIPPLSWAGLFLATAAMRKRKADPMALTARKAGRVCLGKLRKISEDDADGLEKLIEAMREFFGAKLGVSGGALTFADMENVLAGKAIGEDVLNNIKSVFEACEAGRYAGGYDATSLKDLVATARSTVLAVDKAWRGKA